MREDLIYVNNSTSSVIAANQIIPLNTILRKTGNSILSVNNNIVLKRPGYYKVSGTVTFAGSTQGNASVALYKDGAIVPGATSQVTTSATVTDTFTLYIDSVVRVFCCEGSAILTLVNTGVSLTNINSSLIVEYLG